MNKDKKYEGISDISNQDYTSLPMINNNKSINFDSNYNNYFNNSNISSPIFMKNPLGKSLIQNESIRMTNKMTTSLKTVLDKLDLVPELDEKLAEEDISKNENNYSFMKNPRARKFQKFKSVSDLEEINKFNFSIINNQKWGLESLNIRKNDSRKLNIQKPNKLTLAKELGI